MFPDHGLPELQLFSALTSHVIQGVSRHWTPRTELGDWIVVHHGAPPASRPLFDEKIYRFSGWHHHFIWQVVLSFLEFKEKRPSPFWENGVFRFCPESPLRPHLALNRPFVISTCLGQPRWLVIGGKRIKLSWAHGKWPIWHYFNPRGLSFGPPKGP